MRYLVVLLGLCGCASGPEHEARWNTCIATGYFAGDRIRNEITGKLGVVNAVHGPAARCPEKHPVLADVRYE